MSDSFFQLTSMYPDEQSAVEYFERKRWPQGRSCPGCNSSNTYNSNTKRSRMPVYKCGPCGKQFTVTSGTVMNATHLPLRAWLFAFHLVGGSKKGISSHQLARHLGITVKSAWHLTHRIRRTMTNNSQLFGGVVETDETYIGGKRRGRGRGYRGNKIAVQTIVQRSPRGPRARQECTTECPGQAQTIALPTPEVDGRTVGAKLRKHTIPNKTHLMTDESPIYTAVGENFRSHNTVNHKRGDYAHTDKETGILVSTNAAEGLFANLKRQVTGTHHSTSKKHLPKYLEEYDYKYNNRHKADTEIAESAIANLGETKPLSMFKRASGKGESLIDIKQGERPKQKTTKRGDHMKRWPRVGGKVQPD